MAVFFGVAALALIAFFILLGIRHHKSNRGFLEWDPEERMKWRNEQEDVDLHQMLALSNSQRRKTGQDELTLEEYEEQMRRNLG